MGILYCKTTFEWFATLINGEIENVICNSENNGIN